MTLGFLLGLLSASWVWLEMRINTGLMIPSVTLVCLAIAAWKGNIFNHRIFLFSQILLMIAFVLLYGFDPVALRVVPACLFREGYQMMNMPLDTANSILVAILIGGNAFVFRKVAIKK
ncbi:MAG: hypothetical protein WCH07_04300 [Deltaproteobacteria bacterium]